MRSRGAARAERRARAALVVLALAVWGCAGPRRREPPEPALRIWTPGIVFWSGGRRELVLAIENGTSRTVRVEEPAPRRVRVVLFDGPGPDRACGQDADASSPASDPVSLAPGEGRGVSVDLAEACGRLPPGEYRYEVGYEAPAAGSGPDVRLRTAHGHVVVEGGGSRALDGGSLGSQRGAGDEEGTRFQGARR